MIMNFQYYAFYLASIYYDNNKFTLEPVDLAFPRMIVRDSGFLKRGFKGRKGGFVSLVSHSLEIPHEVK